MIEVPLAIVRFHGAWYIASMIEGGSRWVDNVRAASGNARLLHGRWREVKLVEVPCSERAPILKRYLLLAWSARPHFSIDWRAAIQDYERIAPQHVVFRVEARR